MTAQRLESALSGSAPWDDLVELAAEAGDELIPVLRTRYLASAAHRDRIAWLLRTAAGGDRLAVELLPGRTGDEANDLLRAIASGNVSCPEPELRRLLSDEKTRDGRRGRGRLRSSRPRSRAGTAARHA
jgi:hypothetical protein